MDRHMQKQRAFGIHYGSGVQTIAKALGARPQHYTPRKMGLTDRKIHNEKHAALIASYSAIPEVKAGMMVVLYGGRQDMRHETLRVLKGRGKSPLDIWQVTGKFTERGDFSHLQSTPEVSFRG